MNRRRSLLLAGVALVFVVLLYLAGSALLTIRSTQTTEPGPVPEQGAAPDTSKPSPGLSAFEDRRASRDALDFGIDPALRGQQPAAPALGAAAAREYRERARMPESTRPLEGTSDPIGAAHEVSPNRAAGPNGAEPTLTAFPTQVNYEAPAPAIVRAFFSSDGRTIAAEGLTAEFISERQGRVAAVAMNDDGRDGDDVAGDLAYSGWWRPPSEGTTEFRGSYVVSVRGTAAGLEERAVGTGFLYSVPLARPTGRFRDSLADGSLRLEAEIEVFAAARFHAESTLASPPGEMIAWAQNAAGLQEGTHWLPITFYGLVFHEKGIDGPYVVKSFALSTTGEMPNQKNRVLHDAHVTQPYTVASFTDEPYQDPDLLDAAERAERDAPVAPEAAPDQP